MKLPLNIEGETIRDAEGRVIMSALNPCTMDERRLIVNAVNKYAEDKLGGKEDGENEHSR